MRIPEHKVAEVRDAADIVDIISDYVLLKKAGKDFVGLCPFHTEKTPSFSVSADKQMFYCFGCGTGGNAFGFLMQHNGVSFIEAVRMIAGRAGIEIREEALSFEQQQEHTEKEALFEINKLAAAFFHNELLTSTRGQIARDYLEKRGIDKKTIADFTLGYAPDGWDNIARFLAAQRIPVTQGEKAGLLVLKKGGKGHYDRFRSRIMFPIFDMQNRVIGFGGRVLDDAKPKYLNSPETPLYNKSRSLYGLNQTRRMCREKETAYLVEGYFDLIALYQNGIENVAATLGTALTPEHVAMVKRCAHQAVLVYDADAAGIKAVQRSIPVFRQGALTAKILSLPAGEDPDSFVSENGADAFLKAAGQAKGIISFLTDSAVEKHGLSVEGKIRIIEEMKEPLAAITDPVASDLYIKEFAKRVSIDEALILTKIRPMTGSQKKDFRGQEITCQPFVAANDHQTGATPAKREAEDRYERQVLTIMLQVPAIRKEIEDRQLIRYFTSNTLKAIASVVLEHPDSPASAYADMMENTDEKRIIAELCLQEDDFKDITRCRQSLSNFEKRRKYKKNNLLQQIQAAEKDNNDELLIELLIQKQIQSTERCLSTCDLQEAKTV